MNEYVWKLDVEYPEGSQDDEGRFVDDWEPEGWNPSERYILQYATEEFHWPTVRRFYLSRSAAVDRALLLESYGAKVRLLRSEPLEFRERYFRRPLFVIEGGAA